MMRTLYLLGMVFLAGCSGASAPEAAPIHVEFQFPDFWDAGDLPDGMFGRETGAAIIETDAADEVSDAGDGGTDSGPDVHADAADTRIFVTLRATDYLIPLDAPSAICTQTANPTPWADLQTWAQQQCHTSGGIAAEWYDNACCWTYCDGIFNPSFGYRCANGYIGH